MSLEEGLVAGSSSQSLTTLFPAFPPSLTFEHNLHQDIPTHLHAKLKYLYTSLVSLHNGSLYTMHGLSKGLMQIFREEQVCVPVFLQDRFCAFCSICLIPGISCRVRIRPRSRQSKANRCLGKEEKAMRNELMVHCLQCKHVAKKLTGFSRGDGIQPQTPKKEVSASSSSSAVKGSDKKGTSGPSQPQPSSASKLTTSTSGKASGVPGTTGAASAGPKGFSFLDKLNQAIVTNRKPTGPAGFSFKNPSTSSTAGQISQKMVNDGDFIPLTKTAFSHMQAEKNQQVGNKRPHPDHNKQSTGGGGGGVSLLELERLQKKKKRQSLSEGSK